MGELKGPAAGRPSARRQPAVRAPVDGGRVPHDHDDLLHRLIGGDAGAVAELRARAATSVTPAELVAAALLAGAPGDLLARAERCAVTARERQLVAIAAAHLDGQDERLDALVRDHLADHPDNVLAAWIAASHVRRDQPCDH